MDKFIKNKRALELVTIPPQAMKQVQKSPFNRYILSDQVWWCNVKLFLSYSKSYICKFMQVCSWHKLFHFHLTFWIWRVWKGRVKTQKFKYLKNEKSFLDEIKNIFHSFVRAIIRWKNKNLIKNNRHKLYIWKHTLKLSYQVAVVNTHLKYKNMSLI